MRPEKIRLGHGEENSLDRPPAETAYVGVATQYVVETRRGNDQRLRPEQRARRAASRRRARRDLSFEPRLPRSSSIPARRKPNDRPAHPATSCSQRAAARRSRDHRSRHPRRLRPRRHRSPSAGSVEPKLAKTLRFSNWPLYIDTNEKTHQYPSLDQFTKKIGVKVDYIEDINDNATFFGKIQAQLRRGQSIGRDIIVMTDNSRYPALAGQERLGREARQERRSRTSRTS